MLSADPEENQLTPILIINVDKNECLTTDNIAVYLAPCDSRTYQYYIFENVLPENNFFEFISAQEATITTEGLIETKLSTLNNPFGHTPQFYGNILSRLHPEYCLSSLEDYSLTIKICKTSIFTSTFLQQGFSYYNKTLTLLGTSLCITPLKTIACTETTDSTAKWNYDIICLH
jgi:hypothetical protein